MLAAGCGSLPPERAPGAAEPARSPPLTEPPAGRLVPVGYKPEGIAVDPRTRRLAVGLRVPALLAILSTRTGEVLRRVALPGPPRHLSLTRPGGSVIVPVEPTNELVQVPLGPGDRPPVSSRVGTQPHDAAAAAGGRLFVGDELADTMTVLEPDGRRAARFPIARQPGGLAALDGGRLVAAVSVRDRVVELFDARTFRRVAVANAGVGPTHVVADGDRLYVTDTDGDGLLVFATRPKLELRRRLAMPTGPYGIAIDPERGLLWVTLTGTNRVRVLTTDDPPRTIADLPAVRQPNTVGVDPVSGRAFVTGKVDGVVQLLDPPDDRPRERTR